jgi:hypothetical protein
MPLIVLNVKDAPNGRVIHSALRVLSPTAPEGWDTRPQRRRTDRVAAETLVPRRAFFSVSRVVLRRLLTMGRLTRSAYRA